MKSISKSENIYLFLSLIFGLLLVFLIPPFNSPDEDSHFKKSYLVANGTFYAEEKNGAIGNKLPNNLIQYINSQNSYMGKYDKKFNYSELTLGLQNSGFSEEKTFDSYSTSTVNPIAYVIPAFGIICSKLLSIILGIPDTILGSLYCARIFSLTLYSLIIFYAIKISPKYKKTIAAFALMPMSLSLIACVSYDSILIAATALLFAIVCKYRFDDNEKIISKFDLFLVLLIAYIYINIKRIYSFNLLLVFLIPKSKYAVDKKQLIYRIFCCIGILFLAYFVTNLPNLLLKSNNSNSVLISEQIKFVLQNPIQYLKIFFSSLTNQRYFYFTTFIGVLGLLDTYIPYPLLFIYFLFLLLTIIIDSNQLLKKTLIRERLISFLLPTITIFLAFLGMYIGWTSIMKGYGVGANEIVGVQGRYFIPSLMVIGLLFSNNFKGLYFSKLKNIYEKYSIYFYIFILTITQFILLIRFWV